MNAQENVLKSKALTVDAYTQSDDVRQKSFNNAQEQSTQCEGMLVNDAVV